jgi:hypothetical protein
LIQSCLNSCQGPSSFPDAYQKCNLRPRQETAPRSLCEAVFFYLNKNIDLTVG